MSNIDRLRVGGTDYDIQSVVKVYNTIADMNADIANIPNGATVFVKENSPSGLEGDDELDPTSSNWVKNYALAEVVVTVEDGSSTPSIPDSELRHSDMSNTQVNDVNKVPTSALLYQMNSELAAQQNFYNTVKIGTYNGRDVMRGRVSWSGTYTANTELALTQSLGNISILRLNGIAVQSDGSRVEVNHYYGDTNPASWSCAWQGSNNALYYRGSVVITRIDIILEYLAAT